MVVVVRGIRVSDDNPRKINIPWVQPERSYRLRTLLNPRDLGRFTGKQLQQGTVELTLPAAGQEIIEVEAGG